VVHGRKGDAAYFGWQLLVAKPESPPGPGTNEVQRIVFNGGPNGGSLTLSFDGEETAPIPYHPSATQRQNAFTALPNIGFGNCWSPRRQDDPAVDFGVQGIPVGPDRLHLSTTDRQDPSRAAATARRVLVGRMSDEKSPPT